MWRTHLPIWGKPIQEDFHGIQGRVASAVLMPKGKAPISLVSLYLETGGKLNRPNLQLLQRVGTVVKEKAGHFVIGGDWQVEAEKLETTNWCNEAGGFSRCGDPKVGACTIAMPASNIDYFVMSNSVRDIVAAAVIDEGSTTKPHRLV